MKIQTKGQLRSRIKLCLWIVIIGLAVSGLTAFPLEIELELLVRYDGGYPEALRDWLVTIHEAIKLTNQAFPYLSYGTDWLAFAHVILAILFVGPLKDPIKNIWIIEFGMIACLLILPLALIAGPIRQIPFFWRMVDCSFGVFGIIPLAICRQYIKKLELLNAQKSH